MGTSVQASQRLVILAAALMLASLSSATSGVAAVAPGMPHQFPKAPACPHARASGQHSSATDPAPPPASRTGLSEGQLHGAGRLMGMDLGAMISSLKGHMSSAEGSGSVGASGTNPVQTAGPRSRRMLQQLQAAPTTVQPTAASTTSPSAGAAGAAIEGGAAGQTPVKAGSVAVRPNPGGALQPLDGRCLCTFACKYAFAPQFSAACCCVVLWLVSSHEHANSQSSP